MFFMHSVLPAHHPSTCTHFAYSLTRLSSRHEQEDRKGAPVSQEELDEIEDMYLSPAFKVTCCAQCGNPNPQTLTPIEVMYLSPVQDHMLGQAVCS
jgi:hypothetical protein